MYVCLPYLKFQTLYPKHTFLFGLRKFILVTHFRLKAYILCYRLTCDYIGTLDLSINTVGCRGNKSGYWVNLKEVVGNTRGDRVLQLFIGTCNRKKKMIILAQKIRKSEILAWVRNSFLAHRIWISDILSWDRKSYLTEAVM